MDDPKVLETLEEQDTTARDEPAKKPYEKPQIIYRAPLEAAAAVCSGVGFKQSGPCTFVANFS